MVEGVAYVGCSVPARGVESSGEGEGLPSEVADMDGPEDAKVEGDEESDVGVTTAPEVCDGIRAAVDVGDPDEVGSEGSEEVDDVWILFERFGVVVGLEMIPFRCERMFIIQFAQELSVSPMPTETHRRV